jgi:hypothetical protein
VVVAGIVMFNILELIMEIVPNYPTMSSIAERCGYDVRESGMVWRLFVALNS